MIRPESIGRPDRDEERHYADDGHHLRTPGLVLPQARRADGRAPEFRMSDEAAKNRS
jgi:hypothetical protein